MNTLKSSRPPDRQTAAGSDSETGWYLLYTKPRQENIALQNLEQQGYSCYLPLFTKSRQGRQSAKSATEPMFPCYLFIQLEAFASGKSWAPIRSTLGVRHLVRFGEKPAGVDGQLIALLKSRDSMTNPEDTLTKGDTVTITAGPFAGIEAIYETEGTENRVIILLDILSRATRLKIDANSLRKKT